MKATSVSVHLWSNSFRLRSANKRERRKRRDEQVENNAESPEELDWSADDDSDDDDDHNGEEHIDWALLSQEEGERSGSGGSLAPPDAGVTEVPTLS